MADILELERLVVADSDADKTTIASALTGLPEDVCLFALQRCRFESELSPPATSDSNDGRHVVVLTGVADEHAVRRAVAEAWLSANDGDSDGESRANVDELVTNWEFTGPGEDA
jgi:hypothetical protein